MDLAIIKTGGKQYLVKPKDKVRIEKLEKKEGDKVDFDQVLLVKKGKETKIGTPEVKGAQVKGKVLKQGKRKKVIIHKYRASKRYETKKGHRQPFTEVQIEKIALKG